MFFWQIGMVLAGIEILLLALAVSEIGFFAVLGLLLLSAFAGGFLVRTQGMMTFIKAQRAMDGGFFPMDEIFQGLCILTAGFLFMLPGFLSDLAALALLFPMVRKMIRSKSAGKFGLKDEPYRQRDDGVIEGSYVVVEEEILPPRQLPPGP